MATADSSTNHPDSLPVIDLRLLSQSELYSLSLSAATHLLRRSDDDSVIPKIDRSVFNESAGSRKQTFSRLRLAPRNNQNSPVPASSFHIPLKIPDPLDEENSQIIATLQRLFGVESLRNAKSNDEDHRLVPVQIEFKQPYPDSALLAFQNIPVDVVDVVDIVDGGQRKRKRGRPRKNENLEEEPMKKEEGDVEGKALAMVDERSFDVEAVGLEDSADPFGDELKRRTQGLETESQLLEFLEGLNGEWGSQRKKRRIIQASGLGDLLPAGWKIVLSLKRRAGHTSIVCRRYVRFFRYSF